IDNVESVDKELTNKRRKAEQEYNKRVRNRPALERRLQAARDVDPRLPGGGTTQQLLAMKQAGIKKAERAIAANEARITTLREYGSATNDDLQSRIPSLRQLATQLEGNAAIGFELYYSVGDTKVVLFEKGLAEQEELEGAAEEGWSAFD